jgi:putative addiction module component (TIGR02574 family)
MLKGMGNEARRLFEEALRLPAEERTRLASELLASVEGEAEADVEAAWAVEIERRARKVLSGKAVTHDWGEVRQRLEQKHFGSR